MNQGRFASKSRFLAVFVALFSVAGLFYLAWAESGGQLLSFRFNLFALPSLASLVFCFGLLIYFVRKPARTDERIWLAVLLISICIVAGGEMLQRLSSTPEAAMFWTVFSMLGPAMYASAMYLFALAYTNQSDRRYPGTTAVVLTTGFLFAFFFSFTGLIFTIDPSTMTLFPWGYSNGSGPGIIFLLAWADMAMILAVARFINFRRKTRNVVLRQQSLLFIFATLIPVAVSSVTDGVLSIMDINIPSVGVLSALATAALLTYGLLRYQLLTVSPTLFSNTILSIMHEAVLVTDGKSNVLYLNPEAEKLMGVQGGATQLKLLDFVAEPDRASFRRGFGDADKNGTIDLEHINIVSKAGGKTPVRLTSTRLEATDFGGHVIVLTDISKELHTQSIIEQQVRARTGELHQARAYLLASINSLGQGFILINREAKVELINGMAAKLTGLGGEYNKLPMAKVAESIKWDVDLPAAVEKALDDGQPKRLAAAAEGGSYYTIFVTPVLADDEILGAAVIVEDVTEETILDRSKEEFFSIASHELRTPLTAIRGNLSMIPEQFPEMMKNRELAIMVQDSYDASVRLIDVVRDFLDSSRLEQGKMPFDLRLVEVEPLVVAIQKDLADFLTKRKVKLVTHLGGIPAVQADEAKLRQILNNLIENAAKYSEKAEIELSYETKDRMVEIAVTDNGRGISPENQKLLFRKFKQAVDSPLNQDYTQGTGLGLYIAQLIAKGMGGDVVLARSEVGKGSTFVLSLPVATEEQIRTNRGIY